MGERQIELGVYWVEFMRSFFVLARNLWKGWATHGPRNRGAEFSRRGGLYIHFADAGTSKKDAVSIELCHSISATQSSHQIKEPAGALRRTMEF